MSSVKDIKTRIKQSVLNDAFSHAVLFEGEKGTGKMECAIWLAKLLLCDRDDIPCGICDSCRKVDNSNHPDVTVITPEQKKTSIGINEIRDIKDTLYLSPNEGKRKIYIIPEADNMTVEAQNAFLKSLEEPPESVNFILTCENRDFLLDTIVSRTTVYSFDPMSIDECCDELAVRFPEKDRKILCLSSLAYCGSFGAASAALENGEENKMRTAAEMPGLLRKGKIYECLVNLGECVKTRDDLDSFFDIFGNIIVKSSVEKLAGRNFIINVMPVEAEKISEIITNGKRSIEQNGSVDLVLNWFVAEIASVFGGNL